jgi:hypothetical protein
VTEGARTAKRRACSTICCPGGGAAGPGPDTAAPARRRGRTCRGPGVLDLFAGAVIGPSGQLVEEGADDRTCSVPMPPRAWAGGGDGRLRRQRLTGDGLAWPSCAASSRRRRASRGAPHRGGQRGAAQRSGVGLGGRSRGQPVLDRASNARSCDTPTKPLAEAGIPANVRKMPITRGVSPTNAPSRERGGRGCQRRLTNAMAHNGGDDRSREAVVL